MYKAMQLCLTALSSIVCFPFYFMQILRHLFLVLPIFFFFFFFFLSHTSGLISAGVFTSTMMTQFSQVPKDSVHNGRLHAKPSAGIELGNTQTTSQDKKKDRPALCD